MSNYSKTLAPQEPSTKSYDIIGFDTEFCARHLGEDSFVLGTIAYPNGKSVAFEDPYKFVNELLRRKNRGKRFYAHNLSVDLANGIKDFLPDEYEFTVLKVGSRVIKASVTDQNRHQWHFFDSSQISWYASLATLGDLIGMEKQEPDIDLKGCNCDLEVTNELVEYGKRDAEIVTEWMNNHLQVLVNEEFNSTLDNTLAGTTMGVWRRNHQKETYTVLPKAFREGIRGAYNGGRTEVFKKGKIENTHKYDVNSLYPYIYTAYDFPHPANFKMIPNPSHRTFSNHLQKEGFAKATVVCPEDLHIPYLKYFDEDLGPSGKLTFPTGSFTDTWTLLELRKAIELGYKILNVHEMWYSNKTCRPWKDFAEDMYERKQYYGREDMDTHYLITKAFLNSLWGRFGVDPTGNEAGFVKFSNDIEEVRSKVSEMGIAINGQEADALRSGELDYWFEPFDSNAPNYCHPEWAAYTTASARHELYEWFEMVGLENVIYCDTDSVITTETIPDKYLNDELGGMDLEFTGTFEAVREKGYVTYNDDMSVKEVVGSGINQERLGKERAKEALLNNGEIQQTIWGGPSFGGVEWGKVEEIDKHLGSHWVPKRTYFTEGGSKPLSHDIVKIE